MSDIGYISHEKDIEPIDENGKAHGFYKRHYPSTGGLWYTGRFVHGKQVGYWENYASGYDYESGVLTRKTYYLR